MQVASWVQSLAPWTVIAHHTFTWEASLDSTRRIFERFMNENLKDVSYFYAIEENPSRDGHHVHALWSDCEAVLRKGVWSKWFEKYGRSRIEPVRSHHDVAGYCSKYVSKECFERGWWNVSINSPDLWHGRKATPEDIKNPALRVMTFK